MELRIEADVRLPGAKIQLATARWDGRSRADATSGYYLCQRVSGGHDGIQVDSPSIRRAFTRVSSVGLLAPSCRVDLLPVEQPLRTLNCVFDTGHFEATTEIDAGFWQDHAGAFLTIRNPAIEATMRRIHGEILAPGFASEVLMEAASTALLVEVARHGRRYIGRTAERRATGGMPAWQLRRIADRVAAGPACGYPALAELAGLCGISESHLMRTFKATTGQRVHEYVAGERLAAARAMLMQDGSSLKQIAHRLGFSSQANFATAFKRMTGLSPGEFRRLSQGGGTVAAQAGADLAGMANRGAEIETRPG